MVLQMLNNHESPYLSYPLKASFTTSKTKFKRLVSTINAKASCTAQK